MKEKTVKICGKCHDNMLVDLHKFIIETNKLRNAHGLNDIIMTAEEIKDFKSGWLSKQKEEHHEKI
tara:strand:+ start:95 stop:292 length:198 start_codon:yes stop_codon:yes gene_type:complete